MLLSQKCRTASDGLAARADEQRLTTDVCYLYITTPRATCQVHFDRLLSRTLDTILAGFEATPDAMARRWWREIGCWLERRIPNGEEAQNEQ